MDKLEAYKFKGLHKEVQTFIKLLKNNGFNCEKRIFSNYTILSNDQFPNQVIFGDIYFPYLIIENVDSINKNHRKAISKLKKLAREFTLK